MLVGLALTLLGGLATAEELEVTTFDLVSRNTTCLPDARGEVTVLHKEEKRGVDILLLHASGLPANTEFTVFLTEADAFATPPFGASVYIGDFTTNDHGKGSLKVETIVGEAFVSSREGVPPTRVRHDLDKVVIWFVSADYDDAVFADPFSFDIHRSPNQHVAFGLMSPHLCLGAQLARLEVKVLFEELLPRLADVRIDGPIDRLRSNFIAGIKRLPITVTVA